MIPIADLADPRVAGYRDVRDRELRGRDGLFVVESAACVARLLRSRFEVESLLLTPERRDALREPLAALPAATPVFVAPEPLFLTVSGHRIHGGALALARRPPRGELASGLLLGDLEARVAADPGHPITVLALAGVTHMDNVGSLFRSSAGLGVDAVLLDERCCDPLLRKPIRVAMGHSLLLPFGWSQDLAADLRRVAASLGAAVVGAESQPAGGRAVTALDALAGAERLVLLLGNEGHGLEPELLDACDTLVEIPMRDGVPSLNVAVAGAVVLWACAAARRRAGE